MSFRKRTTMTPRRLAANAADATKSTGPRTAHGKLFSKANGQKGDRPSASGRASSLRRAAEAEGRTWGPGDPGFTGLVLEEMQRENPEALATLMGTRPEYRELLDVAPPQSVEMYRK
jgi:hypothetical protein